MNKRLRNKRIHSKNEKVELPTRLAGLTKTHRLIMIEKQKELQFMILCDLIRRDDFKKERAESQKELRREKRLKKCTSWLIQNDFSSIY